MNQQAHLEEGYDGPAELLVGEGPTTAMIPVRVILRGMFQPLDGRYHWYGRVAADHRLDELVSSGASVVLRIAGGQAAGRLSDRDPWGRYRIAATGRPPFAHDSGPAAD